MPIHQRVTVQFPIVTPLAGPRSGADASRPSRPPASAASEDPEWSEEPPTLKSLRPGLASPTLAESPSRALLTVLVGVNEGQVFTLERDVNMLGRAREASVCIEDTGVSRKHARILRAAPRKYVLEDLASTNGVFVNGRRVARAELADGDRVQLGPSIVFRFCVAAADEEALARRLFEGSTHDALTHLYNRKYASERLNAEVAYAHRHASPLGLILCDLDHFKRVNDAFGHAAGDIVLRVVAAQAQRTCRLEDVLARYGGEEFVAIVRGIDHKQVALLAERLRRAVAWLSIPLESRTLKITISVGVASVDECGADATAESLLALADERLYRAKAAGRNRVAS